MAQTTAQTNQTKKTSSVVTDLAFSGAFLVWGLMFTFFPSYARIVPEWHWPFEVIGYTLYALALLGTVVGVSKMKSSEFGTSAAAVLFLAVLAYGLHALAETVTGLPWLALALRTLVFILLFLAVMGFAVTLPKLIVPRHASPATSNGDGVSPTIEAKSRSEQIVALVIAILSLLAAIVPFVQAWLRI